ncbi:MAG: hypothetical protein JXA46_11755 [Dehalococcoidales bacterium]|nr:hypothetical protein [Dehalococcoidales bacterium]
MPRRIIGQCSTNDFKDIEKFAISQDVKSIESNVANLSRRQNMAIRVIYHFQQCGVPYNILLKIREVLVWEMPGKGLAFEYKLTDPGDAKTAKLLQNMQPLKGNAHE